MPGHGLRACPPRICRTLAGQSVAWRHLLARHQQALLAQAQQSVACNASHSVEERLSRWLLRTHDLWQGETLPMTQELLARMLGVQRNAVSIVAHALQQAGVHPLQPRVTSRSPTWRHCGRPRANAIVCAKAKQDHLLK